MKRLFIPLILLIMVIILMIVWTSKVNAKESNDVQYILSDHELQFLSIQYLEFIICDMDFLVNTKPASWKAFWNDLKRFKYIESEHADLPGGGSYVKSVKEFYRDGGGDCDEYMVYIIARLVQFKIFCGFIIALPEEGQGHGAAVWKTEEDEYIVVDPQIADILGRHSSLFALSKYVDLLTTSTHNYKAYRVWMFFEPVENQFQIQMIRG